MSAPRDNKPLDLAILVYAAEKLTTLDEYFERDGRWPFKVMWRRLERLTEKGLLDYGVSQRTAWITEKGRERATELLYLVPIANFPPAIRAAP